MKNVSFEDWLALAEDERLKIHLTWDTYVGEGHDIAKKVLGLFKEKYGKLTELEISNDVGVMHGGTWTITVFHPFIFDRRKIPSNFLGIYVRDYFKEIPEEFKGDYVWAPENYEKYVDAHIDEIRTVLENQNLSREEILNLLVGGDFSNHKKHTEECKAKGIFNFNKGIKGDDRR